MAELAPPPNFVILGLPRNATRWLRSNLDRRPDVFAAPIDAGFFTVGDRMAELGHRWYREQFIDSNGQRFLGECSSTYLAMASEPALIADRIRKHLPGVRLVAIVGDPLECFQSAVRHNVRWGKIQLLFDIERLYVSEVEPELCWDELAIGLQALAVLAYRSRFREQLLVISKDDIVRDPGAVYRTVLGHIGADPSFVPDEIEIPRFSDRKAVEVPVPSLQAKRRLYTWYRRDVEVLAEMLDRDLSAWDPGVEEGAMTPEELLAGILESAGTNQEV